MLVTLCSQGDSLVAIHDEQGEVATSTWRADDPSTLDAIDKPRTLSQALAQLLPETAKFVGYTSLPTKRNESVAASMLHDTLFERQLSRLHLASTRIDVLGAFAYGRTGAIVLLGRDRTLVGMSKNGRVVHNSVHEGWLATRRKVALLLKEVDYNAEALRATLLLASRTLGVADYCVGSLDFPGNLEESRRTLGRGRATSVTILQPVDWYRALHEETSRLFAAIS